MVPPAHSDSEPCLPSLGLSLDLASLDDLFKGSQQLAPLSSQQNDFYDLPWSFVSNMLPATATISPAVLHQPNFAFQFHEDFSSPPTPKMVAVSLNPAKLLPPSPVTDSDSSSDNSTNSVPSSTASTLLSLPSDGEISDLDAYGMSDDEKDEDYSPWSSRSLPRRRRQAQTLSEPRRKARSTTPPCRSSRKSPYSTPRRPRTAPPSRVHQVSGELAELMRTAVKRTDVANSLNYTCPDVLCGFKMKTKPRMPDFRRHLKAHLREADGAVCHGHICRGILFEEFEALPEWKQEAIRSNDRGGTPYLLAGETRIGGCRQSFSRGDALTRHIKSRTNACVGFVSRHLEGCH